VSGAGDDVGIGVGSGPLLEVGAKTHGARIGPIVGLTRREKSVGDPGGQGQSAGNDDDGECHQSLLVFVPDFSHSLTPLVGLIDKRIVHVEHKILADGAGLEEGQRKHGVIVDIEINGNRFCGLLGWTLSDG
jgi:hypothetical protein